jgi:hypothetical protein
VDVSRECVCPGSHVLDNLCLDFGCGRGLVAVHGWYYVQVGLRLPILGYLQVIVSNELLEFGKMSLDFA